MTEKERVCLKKAKEINVDIFVFVSMHRRVNVTEKNCCFESACDRDVHLNLKLQ